MYFFIIEEEQWSLYLTLKIWNKKYNRDKTFSFGYVYAVTYQG